MPPCRCGDSPVGYGVGGFERLRRPQGQGPSGWASADGCTAKLLLQGRTQHKSVKCCRWVHQVESHMDAQVCRKEDWEVVVFEVVDWKI